jgi:hypothetical protein
LNELSSLLVGQCFSFAGRAPLDGIVVVAVGIAVPVAKRVTPSLTVANSKHLLKTLFNFKADCLVLLLVKKLFSCV